MILPKGTLDFEQSGGETAITQIFDKIGSGSMTGYILLVGKIDDPSGEDADITGQMVFKEGMAVLCETVVTKTSSKGKKGVYDLLQGILKEGNSIEFRTKIDVEPPIAFFKECALDEGDVDIEKFMEAFQAEAEERKKREEEKRLREARKEEWKVQVEEWISSGYEVPSYPSILEKGYDEFSKWFTGLSQNISSIKEELNWLVSIEEVELGDQKDQLIETLKKAEEIDEIRSKIADFKTELSGVEEKRNEIQKWVNLWKDEGYNTDKIETVMHQDLETAWNAMTHFMDDIQRLKDAKDELERMKEDQNAKGFSAEITDIEFMLNDPEELENIDRSITELKDTIENEKGQKEGILDEARKIKDGGLDASYVMDSMELRASELRTRMDLLNNNASRIHDLRLEVGEYDKRDIPREIDGFISSLNDPLKLEDYEKGVLDLQSKLSEIEVRRNDVKKAIEDWRSQGFQIQRIEDSLDQPIEQLETMKEDFSSKIMEIKGLRGNISQMDHRWLEEEFDRLEKVLNDPSQIEDAKETIKDLSSRIESRESKREMVKKEMEEWITEGFIVDKLNAVIEDDESIFIHIFNELKGMISEAREMMNTLDSIDTTYFKDKAAETRARLLDPSNLESSREILETLGQAVEMDRKQRDRFKEEVDKLNESGWHTEGLLDLVSSTTPEELHDKIEGLRSRIAKLNSLQEEIDGWDELEARGLKDSIDDLRDNLKRVMDHDGAVAKFEDISSLLEANKQRREAARTKINDWKEVGYITKKVEDVLESDIDTLTGEFDILKAKIDSLESLQATFDSLDITHFKAEAEEIEFKLNDPDAVEEIEASISELSKKIEEDQANRDNFRQRIDDYVKEGFMNARKLEEFLKEEITIVELEFDNFKKEVELFKEYMEKVGYSFKGVEEEDSQEEDQKKTRFMTPMELNESATFDDLIIGKYNGVVHKAAAEVADNPGRDYNPLFIIAPMGLGKTHMLHAIANHIKGKDPESLVSYVTIEKFADDLEKAMDLDRIEDFRGHYRSSDVILIDDIPFISGREETQEELFNTFNTLFESGKQIVITSDRHPKDIPKLASRLRSRFEGGIIVEMEQLDDDTKVRLIELEANRIKLSIPEDTIQSISPLIKGNVRDIKGIVQTIGMKYKTEGKVPDEKLIERIISDRTVSEQEQKLDKALDDMKESI